MQVICVTLVMEGLSLFYCTVSGVQCLPVSHESVRDVQIRESLGMVSWVLVRYGSGILYLVCFFRLLSCFHVLLFVKLMVITTAFSLFHFLGGTGWQKQ